MDALDLSLVPAIVLLLVSGLALGVPWWLGRRYLAGAVGLVARARVLFGDTGRTQIVSAGLATWIFPEAVWGPLGIAVDLARLALVEGSVALSTVWAGAMVACGASGASGCFIGTGALIASTGARALPLVLSPLDAIPGTAGSVLGWMAVATVIGQLASGNLGRARTADGAESWWTRRAPAERKSVALFGILLGGAYLSIAAIVAIPALGDQELAEEASAERLEQALTQQAITEEALDKEFPADPRLASDPLSEAAEALEDLQQMVYSAAAKPLAAAPVGPEETVGAAADGVAAPADDPPATAAAPTSSFAVAADAPVRAIDAPTGALARRLGDLKSAQAELQSAREAREQARSRWKALRQAALRELVSDRTKAVAHFRMSNLGRRGSRETVRHFQLVEDWYRLERDRQLELLSACRNTLDAADNGWRMWASDRARWARSAALDPAVGWTWGPSTAGSRDDGCGTASVEDDAALPERPQLGSDLGPFALVAGWLLRTESISLALITGMLGCGLLGAAGASVIRGRPRAPGEPLAEDLESLLIRGVSAALVVFLAVAGGLSVFADGDTAPSPHMLMFTCLLAAVYSEDVWKWAREVLAARLGGGAGGGAAGGATETAGGATETAAGVATETGAGAGGAGGNGEGVPGAQDASTATGTAEAAAPPAEAPAEGEPPVAGPAPDAAAAPGTPVSTPEPVSEGADVASASGSVEAPPPAAEPAPTAPDPRDAPTPGTPAPTRPPG